jgi:phosphatidylglycerol:prolipoprotein diacylglycerol transferase
MITIDINPVLAQIGPFAIRWYGLMYVVGIIVGLFVALPYAKEKGLKEDDLWGLFYPAAIAGFIGARLYFVVQQPLEPYIEQPWRILATWEGGMAFFGAIFAVVATLAILCRRRGIPFWVVADAGAMFAVVGQAFGRIGNIINGDIVGYPTTLPWGVVYANPASFVADHTIAYQPAAAYELLFNIALFAAMWFLRRRLTRPGSLFAFYLASYSVGQFVLFFWRANDIVAFGLKQAQCTALVTLVLAALIAWWVTRREYRVST